MAASAPRAAPVEIAAEDLIRVIARMFMAAGVAPDAAAMVAEDLVAADLEGVASHGVSLVPMYVERLHKGSVAPRSAGEVVADRDGAIVIDAGDALGQLTARQAVALAVDRARRTGLAGVAVRNAFHFGTAGRYARMMADAGCIGIVMSNTRPLMPAPGGAEALVGNNPVAIAVPSDGAFAAETDMALSATAMGKIRLAAAAGEPIPPGWAVDAGGAPTTDPATAIKGMLLPAAGPKGFGLAFLFDLLCGGLSGGAIGPQVTPLYGDPAVPYRCSHFFLAIDAGHFAGGDLPSRTAAELSRVSQSRRAFGTERVYAPGELTHATRERNAGRCRLDAQTAAGLVAAGATLGLALDPDLVLKEGQTP